MDSSLSLGITAFTSLFAIVDPFAALPVYLALTSRETVPRRHEISARAAITVVTVLTVFATIGQGVFSFFGIDYDRAALYAGILLVGGVSWIVLRSASGIARVLGRTGMNIIARIMGLILAAVAAQFIIDGLTVALPILRSAASPGT